MFENWSYRQHARLVIQLRDEFDEKELFWTFKRTSSMGKWEIPFLVQTNFESGIMHWPVFPHQTDVIEDHISGAQSNESV